MASDGESEPDYDLEAQMALEREGGAAMDVDVDLAMADEHEAFAQSASSSAPAQRKRSVARGNAAPASESVSASAAPKRARVVATAVPGAVSLARVGGLPTALATQPSSSSSSEATADQPIVLLGAAGAVGMPKARAAGRVAAAATNARGAQASASGSSSGDEEDDDEDESTGEDGDSDGDEDDDGSHGSDADEEDDAGSEYAAAAAPVHAPPRGARRVAGYMRQRIRTADADAGADGTEAAAADADAEVDPHARRAKICPHRCLPVCFGWSFSTTLAMDSARTSFERIMAARCLAEQDYDVEVRGINGAAPEVGEDGLAQWVCGQLAALLRVDEAHAELAAQLAATAERSDGSSGLVVERLVMRLPMLRRIARPRLSTCPSSQTQDAGLDIDGETLRDDDGKVYKLNAEHVILEGARTELHARVEVDGQSARVRLRLCKDGGLRVWRGEAGEPDLSDEAFKSVTNVSVTAVETALQPSHWNLREVVAVRARHSHAKRQHDLYYDPQRALLLACALAGSNNTNRWVELLKLASAHMFRVVFDRVLGKDVERIYVCDEETMLWREDTSDAAYRVLLRQVQRDMANLAHDVPRLMELCKKAIEEHALSAPEMAELLDDADEEQAGCETNLRQRLLKNFESRERALLRAVTRWHPDLGGNGLMRRTSLRSDFALGLRIDGELRLDDSNILVFDGAQCYDADALEVRPLTPLDFASISTGYRLPALDRYDEAPPPGSEAAKRHAELCALLREIHDDEEVYTWRVGLRARCLTASQADPTYLESFGTAGGGKGTEKDLTHAAFGDAYFLMIDDTLLTKQKNANANGPSPAKLALKNRRYVVADEVGDLDTDVVKRMIGGTDIAARDLGESLQVFKPKFPVLEVLSNAPTLKVDKRTMKPDDGLQRRLVCCKYFNQFRFVANETEGEEHVRQMLEEECPSRAHYMCDAKYKHAMSLGPTMMVWMIRLHILAKRPGGSFPSEPSIVETWSAHFLANASAENLMDPHVRPWYRRCSCVPSMMLEDPENVTSNDLFDQGTGKPCLHFVVVADMARKMKQKKLANGMQSLYDTCSGRKRSNRGVAGSLRTVTCFCAHREDDDMAFDPKTGAAFLAGDGAKKTRLRLEAVERRSVKRKEYQHLIYGLVDQNPHPQSIAPDAREAADATAACIAAANEAADAQMGLVPAAAAAEAAAAIPAPAGA